MNRHHSTLCMCESTHYFNGRGNIIIFQFLDEVVEPSKTWCRKLKRLSAVLLYDVILSIVKSKRATYERTNRAPVLTRLTR